MTTTELITDLNAAVKDYQGRVVNVLAKYNQLQDAVKTVSKLTPVPTQIGCFTIKNGELTNTKPFTLVDVVDAIDLFNKYIQDQTARIRHKRAIII